MGQRVLNFAILLRIAAAREEQARVQRLDERAPGVDAAGEHTGATGTCEGATRRTVDGAGGHRKYSTNDILVVL